MQDNVSVNPNHTSYNLWPRVDQSVDKSIRNKEKRKPMSNQKARALVQRDYYLNR